MRRGGIAILVGGSARAAGRLPVIRLSTQQRSQAMLLDESRFPLVFLRAHTETDSSIDEQLERNRQFERLLDRQMPFVLIVDHHTHDYDDETPEERKSKALFFKRTKDRMKKYCLGLIVIEGNA